jgi:hypothetical protein
VSGQRPFRCGEVCGISFVSSLLQFVLMRPLPPHPGVETWDKHQPAA